MTGRAFEAPYNRTPALWHRAARPACAALALLAGFSAGSCSYKLGSLFKDKEAENPAYTGSTSGPGDKAVQTALMPPEADLAFAKAAASEALTRGGNDVSIPWENPGTGARGTATPLASSSAPTGAGCREFLVSYVLEGREAWLQGEACRMPEEKWDIRNLRPWNRS